MDTITYLGVKIGIEGVTCHREAVKAKALKLAGMIHTASLRKRNKYEVVRELWKGVAVPSCMFGAELIAFRDADLKEMEKIQNKVGRTALNIPKYAATEGIRGEMGWSTWEERIAAAKIIFHRRIENMEDTRWAKKVWQWRGEDSAWKKGVKKLERKWGTENMSIPEVRLKVREEGGVRWKEGMERKTTLRWYKYKEKPRKEWIYSGSWECSLLAKARLGILETNARQWGDGADRSCRTCGVVETMEHVLIECDAYEDERFEAEVMYIAILGIEDWETIKEQEDQGITTILGIQGREEIKAEITECTKKFLGKIWRKRGQ